MRCALACRSYRLPYIKPRPNCCKQANFTQNLGLSEMGMLRQRPDLRYCHGDDFTEKMTTDQNLKSLGRTFTPYVGQTVILASVTGFTIYMGLRTSQRGFMCSD